MAVVRQLATVVLQLARPYKGRRTYGIYDDLKAARLEPTAAHVSIILISRRFFFVSHVVIVI